MKYNIQLVIIILLLGVFGCNSNQKSNFKDPLLTSDEDAIPAELFDIVVNINQMCPVDESVWVTMTGAELDSDNNMFIYKYIVRENPDERYHYKTGFNNLPIKQLQHNLDSIGTSKLTDDENSYVFLRLLKENNYGLKFQYVGVESKDTAVLTISSDKIKSLVIKHDNTK